MSDEETLKHLSLVRKVAARIARRLPSHIRLEDLVSAGTIGLLEAQNRYDSSRSVSFASYAEFRIRGAILDELRGRDLMARDARTESKQIEEAIQELTLRDGDTPNEEALAKHLGLTIEQLHNKLSKLTPVQVFSVEDVMGGEFPSGGDDVHQQALKRQMVSRLAQAIDQLKERDQQILWLYYQESLTLKQIGEVFEVSEARVSQLLSGATLKLRALLKDFLDTDEDKAA